MVEHVGVPQRPPAYAYLLIDSKDRYTSLEQQLVGNEPANKFSIQRGNALLYGYFTRLAITQVSFDWKLPTVITGYNDTLLFFNTTTQTLSTLTLPGGYYTPIGMADELQTQIRTVAGFGAFTVVYDPTQGALVFDTQGGNSFTFINPYDPYFGPTLGLTQSQQANIAKTYVMLGLNGGSIYTSTWQVPQPPPVVPGVVLQVANAPNFIYTRYIDIVSKELTKYQNVKDNDTSPQNQLSQVVVRLYTTPPNTYIPTGEVPGAGTETDPSTTLGDRPFTLCVDYNTPKHIKWNPNEALYNTDFEVYDEFGDLLPWSLEYPWEFNLTIVASET